jgi:hypothetical protein
MTKVTSDHLARAAYVYVRRSTADHLLHNHESRRRHGLAERAKSGLGGGRRHRRRSRSFRLGVSRPGFERLLAAICEGRIGAVFAIDASRLARNGRDWHKITAATSQSTHRAKVDLALSGAAAYSPDATSFCSLCCGASSTTSPSIKPASTGDIPAAIALSC